MGCGLWAVGCGLWAVGCVRVCVGVCVVIRGTRIFTGVFVVVYFDHDDCTEVCGG